MSWPFVDNNLDHVSIHIYLSGFEATIDSKYSLTILAVSLHRLMSAKLPFLGGMANYGLREWSNNISYGFTIFHNSHWSRRHLVHHIIRSKIYNHVFWIQHTCMVVSCFLYQVRCTRKSGSRLIWDTHFCWFFYVPEHWITNEKGRTGLCVWLRDRLVAILIPIFWSRYVFCCCWCVFYDDVICLLYARIFVCLIMSWCFAAAGHRCGYWNCCDCWDGYTIRL